MRKRWTDEQRERELHAMEIELSMEAEPPRQSRRAGADTLFETVVHDTASPVHAGLLATARHRIELLANTTKSLLARSGRLADRIFMLELVVVGAAAFGGVILAAIYLGVFAAAATAFYLWWWPSILDWWRA